MYIGLKEVSPIGNNYKKNQLDRNTNLYTTFDQSFRPVSMRLNHNRPTSIGSCPYCDRPQNVRTKILI